MNDLEFLLGCKLKTLYSVLKSMYPTRGYPLTQSQICRRAKMTYSYLHRLLKAMEGLGLVTRHKLGREVRVSLTDKGETLAKMILFVIQQKL